MKTSYDGHPIYTLTQEFDVDQKIYPLLKVLWDRGFKTEYSCQGGGRTNDPDCDAYILFYGDVDAKWFAKLIEDNNCKCMYSPRMYQFGGGASVHFSPNLIPKLTKLISAMSDKHNTKFQEEVINSASYVPRQIDTNQEQCQSFADRLS